MQLRALGLVVGASFALAAFVTCMCVKMGGDLVAGVGVERGDPLVLGIGSVGAAAVLGISSYALSRERASIGWQIYGVALIVVVLAGMGAGGTLGMRFSREHVAEVRGQAARICAQFTRARPAQAADCETRAIDCAAEVREHPPAVSRGLQRGDAPGASDEPRNPVERDVWRCLAR